MPEQLPRVQRPSLPKRIVSGVFLLVDSIHWTLAGQSCVPSVTTVDVGNPKFVGGAPSTMCAEARGHRFSGISSIVQSDSIRYSRVGIQCLT